MSDKNRSAGVAARQAANEARFLRELGGEDAPGRDVIPMRSSPTIAIKITIDPSPEPTQVHLMIFRPEDYRPEPGLNLIGSEAGAIFCYRAETGSSSSVLPASAGI